ncbi:phosphotriesterase [uncultured Clostridium sp.]|uniref:phosphotriesterase family protein n=1 Tax=uncultured Clostridium sp. TaxID=59620 RepID=UPI0025FF136E|nr:hypothetical protein [uncultured Clostridium sp.]NLU07973.1 phosphotriesterase [Clostridiales bacterium]
MKVIRTILGDISPEEMGITDSHDHLIRSGGFEVANNPNSLLDDVPSAIKEFNDFVDAGGKTIVCMDPIGCGRNVKSMLKVAEALKNRGHIVMTTGFHKGEFYDNRTSWLATVDIDKIVEMMVAEIQIGMDVHSYNGPVIERTKAKAGVIKAGTGNLLISKLEQKALKVAAITQQETGCAISVHTDLGTMALETAKLLKSYGADPQKVILCHLQRNPDRYYYEEVLDEGVNLCFDGPNKVKYYTDSILAENIIWLVKKGYGRRILLGMDSGFRDAHSAYMARAGKANGVEYMLNRFVSLLKRIGIDRKSLDDILKNNAARIFAIEKDN